MAALLFKHDCNNFLFFRLLPRISHRHIYLTGSDRMKVKLAVQVLSQTMRTALACRPGSENTSELCW